MRYLKKNIGYVSAVNFASKKLKLSIFCYDTNVKLYSNTINNLIKEAKKIKKFGAIGPIYSDKDISIKKHNSEEKNYSRSMLVQTQIFKQINGYDKNFFIL